jgi:hypothetical protein
MSTMNALLAVLPSPLRDVVPSIVETAQRIENSAMLWIDWALDRRHNPVIARKDAHLSVLAFEQDAILHEDDEYAELEHELDYLQSSYGRPTHEESEREARLIEQLDAIRTRVTHGIIEKMREVEQQIDLVEKAVADNEYGLKERLLPQVIRVMERESVTAISSLPEYVVVVELTDLLEYEINDLLWYGV